MKRRAVVEADNSRNKKKNTIKEKKTKQVRKNLRRTRSSWGADLVGAFPVAAAAANRTLGQQATVQQQAGLLQLLANVHVVVHAEDLGQLCDRETLDKVQIPVQTKK
jgi:hypothetical protein